jgi:hypothetical protein
MLSKLMRPGSRHFRRLIFAVAVAISPSVLPQTTPDLKFFSWYDGWGTHQVWGAGKITASYAEASVKCGRIMIKIMPIYDTHSAMQPPSGEQTADFAKSHNLTVIADLQSKGLKCEFAKEKGIT